MRREDYYNWCNRKVKSKFTDKFQTDKFLEALISLWPFVEIISENEFKNLEKFIDDLNNEHLNTK
jgi:hypothetical protein